MKKILLRSVSAMLILCLLCGFAGCNATKKTRYSKQYLDYFDTVSVVVGYEENEAEFNAVCDFVESELARYNKLYDIYYKFHNITSFFIYFIIYIYLYQERKRIVIKYFF